MKELAELIDQMPPDAQLWFDLYILAGVAGGFVFAVWLIGGLIVNLARLLFKRPKAKGKHRR